MASLEQLSLERVIKMFSDQTKMSESETDQLESENDFWIKTSLHSAGFLLGPEPYFLNGDTNEDSKQ